MTTIPFTIENVFYFIFTAGAGFLLAVAALFALVQALRFPYYLIRRAIFFYGRDDNHRTGGYLWTVISYAWGDLW